MARLHLPLHMATHHDSMFNVEVVALHWQMNAGLLLVLRT